MSKKTIPSIILYIFAGLFAVYAVWSLSHSADIIAEAVDAGQITIWGNLYDVISFYMANCAQYFVYGLLLFASGLILQTRRRLVRNQSASMNPQKANDADEELDEWFKEEAED